MAADTNKKKESIVMLSAAFRKKLLALYVGLSFIGCVIAGYLFNLF